MDSAADHEGTPNLWALAKPIRQSLHLRQSPPASNGDSLDLGIAIFKTDEEVPQWWRNGQCQSEKIDRNRQRQISKLSNFKSSHAQEDPRSAPFAEQL